MKKEMINGMVALSIFAGSNVTFAASEAGLDIDGLDVSANGTVTIHNVLPNNVDGNHQDDLMIKAAGAGCNNVFC